MTPFTRAGDFEIVEDSTLVESVKVRGKLITKPAPAIERGNVLRMHPDMARRYREILRRHGVKVK